MGASTFTDASFSHEAQNYGFDLFISRQSDLVRMAWVKDKERNPVDPPPILQLRMREEGSDLAQHHLQSPYYFKCCSLRDASDDLSVPVTPLTALAGSLVSSLQRLKDVSPPKGFLGMTKSSFLSRSVAEQGVKLHISKNPRTMMKLPRQAELPQVLPPRSPDRQVVQIPPLAGFGGYSATSREYAYYEAPVKVTYPILYW
ncbi:hypothetical protein N7486_006664 [Penicillium sp. IBT 16267x]|nr:hypothetical protein N7486_006664 [Penicillium sp. IBT 16267x]